MINGLGKEPELAQIRPQYITAARYPKLSTTVTTRINDWTSCQLLRPEAGALSQDSSFQKNRLHTVTARGCCLSDPPHSQSQARQGNAASPPSRHRQLVPEERAGQLVCKSHRRGPHPKLVKETRSLHPHATNNLSQKRGEGVRFANRTGADPS